MKKQRSMVYCIKAVWVRFLTTLAQLSILTPVRTQLHRMRGVHIGKGSKIGYGVYIDDKCPDKIIIGNNVWIAARCILLAHKRDISKYYYGDNMMDIPHIINSVIIEDGVNIGIGATIMPGVRIGKGAIIGAGSLVTKNIPPYTIAVGSPAKVIKEVERK